MTHVMEKDTGSDERFSLELDGEEKKAKKRKKDDKERDRSRGRDRKRSRSRSADRERRRARSDSGERPSVQQVQPPAATFDHEFEEMQWALNMALIGK